MRQCTLNLTNDVKKEAQKVGFVAIGISNLETLKDLPYGRNNYIGVLRRPEQELRGVKSVIVMAIHAWDTVFNLVVDSSSLQSDPKNRPKILLESYQLYSQIARNKAWTLAHYLERRGFEAIPSGAIPLKTAAVKAGLGCQGKNSLLVTPMYGPRVRLVSVLTNAKLDVDEPFKEDLCRGCTKCMLACPVKAIEPYKLTVNKCIVYASEYPRSRSISPETKESEKRLTKRPTSHSFIECSTCLEACPIGRA